MFATVNGVRLAYSDRGQRHSRALVLLHGFPMDRHLWEAQLSGLSDQVRVIAVDLRGAGESETPPGHYRMDDYADDVAGLLDHLGIQSAVIGGLSMGGYAAFALWRRHPARVHALALCDTRAEPDSPEGRANRDAAIARVQADGVEAFAREQMTKLLAPASQQNVRLAGRALAMMAVQSVAGIVNTLLALRDRPDSRPTLATITVPALLVFGGQDQVTPPAVGAELAKQLPQARGPVIIPGAGHMGPLERPRAVNAALREFLNSFRTGSA